MNLKGAGKRRS